MTRIHPRTETRGLSRLQCWLYFSIIQFSGKIALMGVFWTRTTKACDCVFWIPLSRILPSRLQIYFWSRPPEFNLDLPMLLPQLQMRRFQHSWAARIKHGFSRISALVEPWGETTPVCPRVVRIRNQHLKLKGKQPCSAALIKGTFRFCTQHQKILRNGVQSSWIGLTKLTWPCLKQVAFTQPEVFTFCIKTSSVPPKGHTPSLPHKKYLAAFRQFFVKKACERRGGQCDSYRARPEWNLDKSVPFLWQKLSVAAAFEFGAEF